jgi:hypothetical protein
MFSRLYMCLAFKEIGGYDGMVRRYMSEDAMTNESYRLPNTTCHEPDPNAFRMLREADDDYMPWPGFLLGQTPGKMFSRLYMTMLKIIDDPLIIRNSSSSFTTDLIGTPIPD